LRTIFFGLAFFQLFSFAVFAQTKDAKPPATTIAMPKVLQVNDAELKNLLKPNGKPLLVNFWATWCEPCREEFPDLVKIDEQYKGKLDFITVSLDDAEELTTGVPKFLAEMKAEMPSYLLKTTNEDAVISSVSEDWQGGLPFTILFGADGKTIYARMGKVKFDILHGEIEKMMPKKVK
jgi:thiol-disulfide isomerase/thioredoxin